MTSEEKAKRFFLISLRDTKERNQSQKIIPIKVILSKENKKKIIHEKDLSPLTVRPHSNSKEQKSPRMNSYKKNMEKRYKEVKTKKYLEYRRNLNFLTQKNLKFNKSENSTLFNNSHSNLNFSFFALKRPNYSPLKKKPEGIHKSKKPRLYSCKSSIFSYGKSMKKIFEGQRKVPFSNIKKEEKRYDRLDRFKKDTLYQKEKVFKLLSDLKFASVSNEEKLKLYIAAIRKRKE